VKTLKNKSIILFDGVCNLCNSAVNFIIKHDTKNRFLFASLQSDVGNEILLQFHLKKSNSNSIILIEDGTIFEKSTAALLISKHLNKGYWLLYGFVILPRFIRDACYSLIAKNRYKWFGKIESCQIRNDELNKRFIDLS